MVLSGRKIQLWSTAILLALLFVGFNTDSAHSQALYEPAASHTGDAYYRGNTAPIDRSDWMASVTDTAHLTQLSLPATHDSMASNCLSILCPNIYGAVFHGVVTQTMPIKEQLKAGIRLIDIHLGWKDDKLYPVHSIFQVSDQEFDDAVFLPAVEFLMAHPTETVLIRIVKDTDFDTGINFDSDAGVTFERYRQEHSDEFANYVWEDTNPGCYLPINTSSCERNPQLRDIRGKIVFLVQGDDLQAVQKGIDWPLTPSWIDSQNFYSFTSKADIFEKLSLARDQFNTSNADVREEERCCPYGTYGLKYHENYLTASLSTQQVQDLVEKSLVNFDLFPYPDLSFPYWVAGGDRLPWTDSDPDMGGPVSSSDCPEGFTCACYGSEDNCFFTYPGMNAWAMNYINDTPIWHTGIVYMDFPGGGLIDAVIRRNPHRPPQADLVLTGCPFDYCIVARDSTAEFDASGSLDPDGDPLQYNWDLDVQVFSGHFDYRFYDAPWSDSPIIDKTFDSAGEHYAAVQVNDYYFYSKNEPGVVDMITVLVVDFNVQPIGSSIGETDTSQITPGTIVIRETVQVAANTSELDEAGLEYDASIDWGDGTVSSYTAQAEHFYTEASTYTITFNVSITTPAGDSIESSDETTITVVSTEETAQSLLDEVLALEDQGLRNSLSGKLEDVLTNLEEDDTGSALGTLNAFINQLESQRGKKLTDEQVDTWSAAAAIIINSIEGDAPAGSGLAGAAGGGPVSPTMIGIVIAVLVLGGLGMAAWSRFKPRNSDQLRS